MQSSRAPAAPRRSPPPLATPTATASTAAATASSTARFTASPSTKPATAAYLAAKQAEGKTRKEALRSLKRYLARRVWQLLRSPATTEPALGETILERPRDRETVTVQAAPYLMACVR